MSLHRIDPWVGAVHLRRLMVRPALRRALVAVVALATGLTGVSLVRSAEQARQRWGSLRVVAVAQRDLDPGDTVDAGAVALEERPAAVLPGTALGEVPLGAVVRHPVAAGEALVEARVAPPGLTGVAALVPSGYRAVAVPLGPGGGPPVVVGDQVDVLAVLGLPSGLGDLGIAASSSGDTPPPAGGVAGDPVGPIVERALVVAVGADAISVAVPADQAPAVAAAVAFGTVLLTLAGA